MHSAVNHIKAVLSFGNLFKEPLINKLQHQITEMHLQNQDRAGTYSWSCGQWSSSWSYEPPSRTKAESELACAAWRCLLAAISAEVQPWWSSRCGLKAVTWRSPGCFIPVAGSRPQTWAAGVPHYVSPGGGVIVPPGSDRKGSGSVGVNLCPHGGVTLTSNASLSACYLKLLNMVHWIFRESPIWQEWTYACFFVFFGFKRKSFRILLRMATAH